MSLAALIFCGAVFDLVVVVGGGVGRSRQVVDKPANLCLMASRASETLALSWACLKGLPPEPALGVVQRMLGERFVDDVAHDLDLAVQPVVVENRVRSLSTSRRSRPSRLL